MRVGEALIQTLWVGALWSVGYLSAPVLFQHLPTAAEAGRLAGEMFTVVTWLSMACGSLLLAGAFMARRDGSGGSLRAGLIVAMMALLGASEWLVRPLMEAARLPDGSPGEGFGPLHGLASGLYLLASLAGVLLVAMEARGLRRGGAG